MSENVHPIRPDAGCRCCKGVGMVADAVGEPRPCSRCNDKAFTTWARERVRIAHAEWEAERARRAAS